MEQVCKRTCIREKQYQENVKYFFINKNISIYTFIPSLNCANKAEYTMDDNIFNTLICISEVKSL